MKAVVISIRPKWVEKIANGEKTIEVRKTAPKIETPFKCYIYMTQGKLKELGDYYQWIYENRMKVIGEFICDKIKEYPYDQWGYNISEESFNATMLTAEEFCSYGKQKPLYGLHISNLKIYDKPKEISEFKKAGFMTEEEWLFNIYPNTHCHYEAWAKKFNIECPPQSWCYVEELGERK